MYQIKGAEFESLINRRFAAATVADQALAALPGRFESRSQNTRGQAFNILEFTSDFHTGIQVNQLRDTSHVSLHFQLAGFSDAFISGFDKNMPMQQGECNLLHCVEPESNYLFPGQSGYAYCSVALSPAYFASLATECGTAAERLYNLVENKQSFALFAKSRPAGAQQLQVLQQLRKPQVSDALQQAYRQSKVQELVWLLLDAAMPQTQAGLTSWSRADKERLHALYGYLTRQYLLPHTLESLGRTFLINEFKLKKAFKEIYGTTVFAYIQQLRMAHAQELLRNNCGTAEVAAIAGYNSPGAFVRAFKKQFGYTPREVQE